MAKETYTCEYCDKDGIKSKAGLSSHVRAKHSEEAEQDKGYDTDNLGGRPDVHDYDKVIEKLRHYTENNDVPIIAEFCYKNGIPRQTLYDKAQNHEGLSDAIKMAILKKEAMLEKGSLNGQINYRFAIFSLKQLGWSDKVDVENQHSGSIDVKDKGLEKKLAQMDDDKRKEYFKKLREAETIIKGDTDSEE